MNYTGFSFDVMIALCNVVSHVGGHACEVTACNAHVPCVQYSGYGLTIRAVPRMQAETTEQYIL